jgi:hypothetical protein
MLKETFKFWASGYHVKGPLSPPPPAHKILLGRAACARSEGGGGVRWQVLFFLPRVSGFPWPRSHMTWVFGFFILFAEKV